MELATYGKFKQRIVELLKERIPDIWWDDIPKVMKTANAFPRYLKAPLYGWDHEALICANMMSIFYYGSEEAKKTVRELIRKERL